VRTLLERLPNLSFAQGTAARFVLEGTRVAGIETIDGRRYRARAVVITAGTFLRGQIHVGLSTPTPAGRAGEGPAIEISQAIADIGVTIERFKTGTPPRIDGRSVDFSGLVRQDGDAAPYWFSYYQRADHPRQLPCFLTHTNERLRDIITEHLAESAMYGGAISGRGPRYCPSIEDKVVRFPNAARHQVFLEPEGLETSEMYVNGLSTSLPPIVQLEYLRSVPGLERVEMTRPGYAIEYDYFPPTQLDHTLRVRGVEGLYFAGQVNGTTGYEEAAGQGVVAGLNAAAAALNRPAITFGRDEAFLGVLVDDLVTRGVDEPYRLFTSRAEFRLLLRQDNALRRLFPKADALGLLSTGERDAAQARLLCEEEVMAFSQGTTIPPELANPHLEGIGGSTITEPVRLSELAKRPGVRLEVLLRTMGRETDSSDAEWAAIELRYGGYIEREREFAERLEELEHFRIPQGLEFRTLESLSFEAREKLAKHQPESLGHAGRIPGVSPSDLQNLVMEILKRRSKEAALTE
jgi:tRNA uridine 5-carboxymethylaminomethyl modification enzyme